MGKNIFAGIPKVQTDRHTCEDLGNEWHITTEDNDSEFLEAM